MNRKTLLIIAGVLVLLFVIGYLQDKGMLNFKWQWLTILFAALSGPYKLVKGMLASGKADNIVDNLDKKIEEEKKYRENMDTQIADKEKRIEALNKELEIIDAKLRLIEAQRANLKTEVNKKSVDELRNDAVELFGS